MPEEGIAGINVHDIDLESLAETIEETEATTTTTTTTTSEAIEEEETKEEA